MNKEHSAVHAIGSVLAEGQRHVPCKLQISFTSARYDMTGYNDSLPLHNSSADKSHLKKAYVGESLLKSPRRVIENDTIRRAIFVVVGLTVFY